TLNPQPSTLNPQPSTLNPQPSTLNPQPSTLNPQPSNPNPGKEGEIPSRRCAHQPHASRWSRPAPYGALRRRKRQWARTPPHIMVKVDSNRQLWALLRSLPWPAHETTALERWKGRRNRAFAVIVVRFESAISRFYGFLKCCKGR
ncbi:hypothetical protein T484DRAFT_1638472, partial [Baffinella frigidus]